MNIKFTAIEVEYNEAIDGEIIQVSFDEDPNDDQLNRSTRYIMISQNYEFSGKPTVEWNDGVNDDGGSDVRDYKLTKNIFELTTTDGLIVKVQHDCEEEILTKIRVFLQREFGNEK